MSAGDPGGSCRPTGRDGFALAVVVFLLFAVGIAGAIGYRAVRTEVSLSSATRQGSEAFMAAQAGLGRYLSEVRDTLPDERTYTVLRGEATVTPRRTLDGPFPNRRYLVRSVGTVPDARFGASVVERTVYRMVEHHRVPVEILGAVVSPSQNITLDDVDGVDGRDLADGVDCPEGGRVDVGGVVGGGTIDIRGGGVRGRPRSASYPGPGAVLDSLGVDWDLLTDPSFPVEHDDTWPSFGFLGFGGIPSDSFPTIRWNGDFEADASRRGRGLLIVDGELSFDESVFGGFAWDGLILAGSIDAETTDDFRIEGALVVGLDGGGDAFAIRDAGEVHFHSCNVIDAGRGLAHLEPLKATWWEAY